MPYDPMTQHDSDYLFARQAVWGTAVTANMRRLNCEPMDLDPDIQQRLPNRSYVGQRMRPREAFHVDTKGSMPKFTTRGIARRSDLLHLIFGVMQDITAQSGTTPNFQKTLKFPLTQPDFTASPATAWFATFVKTNPITGRAKMAKDCILARARLSGKEGQGIETRMQYECDWVARGPSIFNQAAPGGTTTIALEEQFDHYDLKTLSIEAVSAGIILREWEIEISNNAFKIGNDLAVAGAFLTFGLNPYDVTVKLKLAWTAAANDIQAAIGGETDHTLVMNWGTTGTAGFFQMTGDFQFGPAPDDDGESKNIDLTGKLIVPLGTTTANSVNSWQVVLNDAQDMTTSI